MGRVRREFGGEGPREGEGEDEWRVCCMLRCSLKQWHPSMYSILLEFLPLLGKEGLGI